MDIPKFIGTYQFGLKRAKNYSPTAESELGCILNGLLFYVSKEMLDMICQSGVTAGVCVCLRERDPCCPLWGKVGKIEGGTSGGQCAAKKER